MTETIELAGKDIKTDVRTVKENMNILVRQW